MIKLKACLKQATEMCHRIALHENVTKKASIPLKKTPQNLIIEGEIKEKAISKNQSTVAQMAERVAGDSRVCSTNPTKEPMECALISQKQHMTINHHKVFATIELFPCWLATLIHIVRHPFCKNVVQIDKAFNSPKIYKSFLKLDC